MTMKDGNWTVESVSTVSQSHATASILLAGLVLACASGHTSLRAHLSILCLTGYHRSAYPYFPSGRRGNSSLYDVT